MTANEEFDTFLKRTTEVAYVLGGDHDDQLDHATNGVISKLKKSDAFAENKQWVTIEFPVGIAAKRLHIGAAAEDAKEAGAKLAARAKEDVAVWAQSAQFSFGFALRNYTFDPYKSEQTTLPNLTMVNCPDEADIQSLMGLAEGVHLTRDLVHEPANILTTTEFAKRAQELSKIGVEVEVLDEDDLSKIGMRTLLAVGQGSRSPSRVAIMKWKNGEGDPLLLVGKGVVFDTGGISLKPSAGMEEMTMDMGGAATVVGTMHAIAKRKTRANVVGIIGIVENMPDGNAQRPGDIVKSLKGDTVEVLNTDAEGRLVLADILWYGQEEFKPKAVIDLATLTGAIIVALGHENAGVFGNDDAFVSQFLAAAANEGEGAWHMPIGTYYSDLLKSKLADVGNIGGRWGGASTAAAFLERFVKEGMPWIHLDIAGVALRKTDDAYAPNGASGWGVRSLVRLIDDHYSN